jgi:hypothetical protein
MLALRRVKLLGTKVARMSSTTVFDKILDKSIASKPVSALVCFWLRYRYYLATCVTRPSMQTALSFFVNLDLASFGGQVYEDDVVYCFRDIS